MTEARQTKYGPNLVIHLDKTNPNFTDRLMSYHDKKNALRATDRDCVIDAFNYAGKIEGYLDALLDLEIINKKEHDQLYNKYCHKHV